MWHNNGIVVSSEPGLTDFRYQIRQVLNGYVLRTPSGEFVFEKIDSLLKSLKEQLCG